MTSSHVLSLMCVDETGVLSGDSVGVRSESVCIGVLCAMPPGECGGEYAARRRGGGRDARSGTNVSTAGSTKRNGNHRISAMNGFVFKNRYPPLVPPLDRSGPALAPPRSVGVPGEVLSRRDERGTCNFGPPTSATSTLPNRVEPARRTTNGRRRAARVDRSP